MINKSKQLNKIIALASQGQLHIAFKLFRKQFKSRKNTEIWLELASLCGSSNLKDACVECCERAIKLDPDYALAYALLGKVYAESGDAKKSLGAMRMAVQLDADNALIQFHCGHSFYILERYDVALRHFLLSLDLNSDNALAHSMAGSCYQAIGAANKLVQHFEASLSIDPTLVDSMVRLGSHYQSVGDFSLAEKYFDRGLAVLPDSPLLLEKKANYLAMTGEKDKAYAIVRHLIDTNRISSFTISIYAGLCSEYGSVDECIELSEKHLCRIGLHASDKRNIGYALGKIYDSAGEYDLAMEKYNMANGLFYGKFNVQSHIEYTNKIIEIYSKEFYINSPRNTNDIKKPIFIVGMPRSGTSLLEQMLSQHSKVYAGGELPYINDIVKRLSGNNVSEQINLDFINNINTEVIAELALEYVNRVNFLSNESECVTDKMPTNFNYLGLISKMFPDAKILHCRRDPLDICLSIYFQNFGVMQPYSSNLKDIASVYLEYDRLMRHWTEVLNIQVYEVRYEDFVVDFENQARDILKYCELEWQDECLNFYKSKRNVATASFDQVNKPVYTKSLARWKNYEKHLAELEEALKPVL